jgi:hypothetical protein
LDIRIELGVPEVGSGCRFSSQPASGVTMPEATMHEHCHPHAWQDDVWPARQMGNVDPEAQTRSMQIATNA